MTILINELRLKLNQVTVEKATAVETSSRLVSTIQDALKALGKGKPETAQVILMQVLDSL